MKNRVLIIVLSIAFLAVFAPIPRANADPLTIIAVVGIATVLSAGTVDMVAGRYDDDRDMRAQREEAEKANAKAPPTEKGPDSDRVEMAALPK